MIGRCPYATFIMSIFNIVHIQYCPYSTFIMSTFNIHHVHIQHCPNSTIIMSTYMYHCQYCKYTVINPTANQITYHTKAYHPEMKRSYNKYSSDYSSTSNSSSSTSVPPPHLLLMEDAQPPIISRKRHPYENLDEDFIEEVKTNSEKVQNLLSIATQLYSEKNSHETVREQLAKLYTREEALILRPKFSELQNRKLLKKKK